MRSIFAKGARIALSTVLAGSLVFGCSAYAYADTGNDAGASSFASQSTADARQAAKEKVERAQAALESAKAALAEAQAAYDAALEAAVASDDEVIAAARAKLQELQEDVAAKTEAVARYQSEMDAIVDEIERDMPEDGEFCTLADYFELIGADEAAGILEGTIVPFDVNYNTMAAISKNSTNTIATTTLITIFNDINTFRTKLGLSEIYVDHNLTAVAATLANACYVEGKDVDSFAMFDEYLSGYGEYFADNYQHDCSVREGTLQVAKSNFDLAYQGVTGSSETVVGQAAVDWYNANKAEVDEYVENHALGSIDAYLAVSVDKVAVGVGYLENRGGEDVETLVMTPLGEENDALPYTEYRNESGQWIETNFWYYGEYQAYAYYRNYRDNIQSSLDVLVQEEPNAEAALSAACLERDENLKAADSALAAATQAVSTAETGYNEAVAAYGQQYAQEEAIEAFVTRLYKDILGRMPDQEGFFAQVEGMKTQGTAHVCYNFFASEEFKTRAEGMTNAEVVENVYQAMLDRSADEAGLVMWTAYLDNGMTACAIAAGFVEAPEFVELCDEYGIESGSADELRASLDSRDRNAGVTAFAQRLYREVLDRDADIPGLNCQCTALLSSVTCCQIALNFFNSPEFAEGTGADQNAAIATAYKALLGRTGAEEEVAAWSDRMDEESLTLADVVFGFCQSDEFEAICAACGMTSGAR